MTAARLDEIAEFLFEGERGRVKPLAAYLGVNQATVFRWRKKNEVPVAVAKLMEMSFQYGLYKGPEETEVSHG